MFPCEWLTGGNASPLWAYASTARCGFLWRTLAVPKPGAFRVSTGGVLWVESVSVCMPRDLLLEPVEGTADSMAAAVEDMGVDHGGLDMFVAEKLLHGPDIVTALEQVGCE